nr:T9SS sorting signal type C domain-containing protein [uncultured Flavobacterium sp.]
MIDNATLTGYPIPTISSFTPTIGCSNSTSVVITGTNFTGVSTVRFGGTNAASYVVNSATQITAVPAAGSSGAISVIASGGTATSGSSFTVNATPTVSGSASPTTICSGGNVTLNASVTSPTTQNTVLLSEGFNGATNSWIKTNNSTGGTPANAAWTLRPDGYSYTYPGYSANVFHSNDNSQFYLSNSAAQGDATTATILQSPIMNSVGYTSLSLEFYQHNLDFDGTDFARVEVSTNGTSWTTLSTTTTTQGAQNNFLRTTVNLDSYINQATLYIRLKYDAQFDWFWAIDNVTVSGNKTIDYTYSWTASPSGTAGLPSGAGTASTTNNTIVANPTVTTAYTVTATNPITGCTGTANVNVTVNPELTITLTDPNPTICVNVGTAYLPYSATTGNPGNYSVDYDAAANAAGFVDFSNYAMTTSPLPLIIPNGGWNVAPGTYNGMLTVKNNTTGCVSTQYPISITISSPSTIIDVSVSASANPVCIGTSVTFTATPNIGSTIIVYQWNVNGVDVGTNSSTYSYIPTNGDVISCNAQSLSPCARINVLSINSITMSVNTTNTWTGTTDTKWFTPTNWFCGSVPTASSDVTIPNVPNKPIIDDTSKIALANTLIVDSGSSLTLNTGNTLQITGKLTNNGGTITFEDSASLVQTTAFTGDNEGNITYKRNYTGGEMDYTYWSSPVALQNLGTLSPLTDSDKFYSFNGTDWIWENPTSTDMTVGKGYIIRGVPPPTPPTIPPGFNTNLFIGVPNNGNKSISVGGGQNSYLLGNPYPSAIDADAFILANTAALDGTLYFWTHNTPIAIGTLDPGTGTYAYSGNDYATYTLSGGVATSGNLTPEWVDKDLDRIVDLPGEYSEKNGVSGMQTAEWTDSGIIGTLETGEWTDINKNNIAETGEWTDIDKDGILDLPTEWSDTNGNSLKDFGEWTDDTNSNGVFNTGEWTDTNGDKILNLEVEQVSNRPTGKIAAGQGFFTTSTATGGMVNFTNAMRVDGSGIPLENTNFYKTKSAKVKVNTTIEKNRVWLNLRNKEGAFKQTLVGYITGATNTWDKLYDGESFDGNDFLDFYSINSEKKLTIQGRALPFDENDEIPLGFRIAVEGTFTISIDETDGVLSSQPIFIEDKLTNTVFDLKSGNYTFKTVAGTFDDRFVLRYTNKTLGTTENELAKNKIIVSVKNKQIKIDAFAETIDKVTIYDLLGRQIYQKGKINSNECLITDFRASHETFIVKTTLQNGKTATNKVIF